MHDCKCGPLHSCPCPPAHNLGGRLLKVNVIRWLTVVKNGRSSSENFMLKLSSYTAALRNRHLWTLVVVLFIFHCFRPPVTNLHRILWKSKLNLPSFILLTRLQNSSIPYTLSFCTKLKTLLLDDNLLDALPGFLLKMHTLETVHRHGNHNYFKATFMWYHTVSRPASSETAAVVNLALL